MLKNHFRAAFRNILKQKIYNILNTIGLATGIASGLIIALHIQEELSYEKDFPDHQNIYRLHIAEWAKSSPPLADAFREATPGAESVGRFANYGTRVANTDNNNPGEVSGYYADSTVLDIFSLAVLEGDKQQALATPGTAVVTQKTAKRFFPDQDPIGKVLHFDNLQDYTVTAVIGDLPVNSHLKFDYLISMPTFYKDVSADWLSNRGWMVMYTYVKFKSHADYNQASASMPKFIAKFYEPWGEDARQMVEQNALRFIPLTDIHLRSDMEQEMALNSNILYVYVFIVVEILILIIASANFMSLFTTQAIRRTKEVGMRKILGAKPRQLMFQFFTEVILLAIISFMMAVVLYQLVLPFYNSISGKDLGPWQIFQQENLVIIGIIMVVIVLVSGLYPAFFIARFKAGSFLKEQKLPSSMSTIVRNSLVVFQFAVSVALIAATILVRQQMGLIQNKELGFDKDQVVNIKLYGRLWWKATSESDVFKNEFMKNPDILAVGKVSNMIGDDLSVEGVVPEGKEENADDFPSVRLMRIDEDYLDVMSIPLSAGRNFSTEYNDSASFIINETAARILGLQNPVGERLNNVTRSMVGTVVGVVKDYHFASLHNTIEPLVLEYRPQWTDFLTLKMRAGKTAETLEYIKSTVKSIAPNNLLVYNFLDDKLNALYKSEDSMGKVFQFFSILAIIIACLGLLSLSAYTIESRTKEIGIRKVLGATVPGIVTMVSSRFFRLVVIAFVIAVPLTWYVMKKWLNNFAYQINVEWWVFAITGVLIFAIATLAVSFHTIAAATANPVKSLRYE